MKEIKVERTLNGRGKQDRRPLPLFIDLHRLSQSMFGEEIGRLGHFGIASQDAATYSGRPTSVAGLMLIG